MKGNHVILALTTFFCMSCSNETKKSWNILGYQTSSSGDKLTEIQTSDDKEEVEVEISLNPQERFQKIEGFGGAFTESTCKLLMGLPEDKRAEVVEAYFGESGAKYSLTRAHMSSCDFSVDHYSYASVPGDTMLNNFTIEEDLEDIIPIIKNAQSVSKNGFKIIGSPWSAPPWMKDNNDWYGGKLKPEYYETWARFFVKYHRAYAEQGIDIWGYTPENEPLGNDSNWESMHFTPDEMVDLIKNHLGPMFQEEGIKAKLLVYDQNKDETLEEWAKVLFNDTEVMKYIYGTAVHWYSYTSDWAPTSLQFVHNLAPEKHIISTEACVDNEVPHWQDDEWYWKKEATDWGWTWAKPENKKNHPKYVPVYRYARDIIGSLNNWVEGWVDWNMVLDRQGGPNLAKNWCIAPVIVDDSTKEVYYTPLYYTMAHFSKYIQPGATRIGFKLNSDKLMVTAVENPDGTTVVIVLNMTDSAIRYSINRNEDKSEISIPKESIQTFVIS